MTYYALFDLQNGDYMHTAYNATSLEELKEGPLSYYSADHAEVGDEYEVGMDQLATLSAHELANYGELSIDQSNTPFN